ncbi:MFS transporter [Amycolatopsis sp. cmx-4-68]|uniref:MFS transporter n=1 Tax=Amycolatopsis sp. cmx-4-68 TaxID=2790938 RepID=UPI00397B418D
MNGYSGGSVTGGVYTALPGLLMLPYLTDVLDMSALAAGIIVLLQSLWLVIVTPWVGRMSDLSSGVLVERTSWVWLGGLGLAVAFPLVFVTPFLAGQTIQTVTVVTALIASATLYACFQGPYMAFAADVGADEQTHTRLMARRVLVLAVTILVVGAAAPAVHTALPGSTGFRVVGLAAGLLIAASTVVSCVWAPHPSRPHRATSAVRRPGAKEGRRALRRAPFRSLLANYALQGIGTGASLSGLVYVATYVLHDAAVASGIFLALFGATILSVPVWERVGARLGKRGALMSGTVLYVCGCAAMLDISALPRAVIYAVSAVIGVGYGAMQVFPMSMLPDVTRQAARVSGRPMRAGLFGGVWTSVETGSLAAGSVAFSVVLALGGYRSAADGQVAEQTPEVTHAMVLGFAGLPAVALLLSLVPLLRYRLTPPRTGRTKPLPSRHAHRRCPVPEG